MPDKPQKLAVILGHGAGGTMKQPFMTYFQKNIAEAGYPCLCFNFFYSEAKRRVPDPQPLLIRCFEEAMKSSEFSHLVIGGKSMGGRIASYIQSDPRVSGYIFLGYPLHPPGKHDQLRDQHLYSIRKPMLFVSGTKDPFAKTDLLNPVLKKIGKPAYSYFVEGGGHSFEVPKKSANQQEVNAGVVEAILKFLDEVTPPA